MRTWCPVFDLSPNLVREPRKVPCARLATCHPFANEPRLLGNIRNTNVMTLGQVGEDWFSALSRDSPLPLWVQITQRLRAAMMMGMFGPGSVLPSETELNHLFGVSRATSRAALNELEREGLIVRRAGKGSIVLRQKVNQPAEEMGGFSEDMIRRRLRPSYRTLEAGKAVVSIQIAEALEIRSETRVFRSRRLLLAEGEPMGLAISWIPPRVLRGITPPTREELTQGSLYEWMFRNCGTRLVRAREFIEAAEAEAEMAALLEVPAGAPLLIARRQSFDQSGKPAEYSLLHFRSDRYRFQIEVTRKANDAACPVRQGTEGGTTPLE